MQKKCIITLMFAIGVIIILSIIFILQNEKITKVTDHICEISSFTITDNVTEIDINNTINKNIDLNKITLELCDSTNNKINTINKNIVIN